jgi:hypothetical protein
MSVECVIKKDINLKYCKKRKFEKMEGCRAAGIAKEAVSTVINHLKRKTSKSPMRHLKTIRKTQEEKNERKLLIRQFTLIFFLIWKIIFVKISVLIRVETLE